MKTLLPVEGCSSTKCKKILKLSFFLLIHLMVDVNGIFRYMVRPETPGSEMLSLARTMFSVMTC